MVNLAEHGFEERNGVLIQVFNTGRAMQVRLEPDKQHVRSRLVSVERAFDTESHSPEWTPANQITYWRQENSPIWQWLLARGMDVQVVSKTIDKAGRK